MGLRELRSAKCGSKGDIAVRQAEPAYAQYFNGLDTEKGDAEFSTAPKVRALVTRRCVRRTIYLVRAAAMTLGASHAAKAACPRALKC